MKKRFKKLIGKAVDFLRWMWGECRDWRTFLLLAVVCIAIGSPVWGGYLLYFLFGWEWAAVVASAVFAFWWIPGMPFFAISVTVTLTIKRIGKYMFDRKRISKISSANTPPPAESIPVSEDHNIPEETIPLASPRDREDQEK